MHLLLGVIGINIGLRDLDSPFGVGGSKVGETGNGQDGGMCGRKCNVRLVQQFEAATEIDWASDSQALVEYGVVGEPGAIGLAPEILDLFIADGRRGCAVALCKTPSG